MSKWEWKLRKDKGKLWHQTITGKYGDLTNKSNVIHSTPSPIVENVIHLRSDTKVSALHQHHFTWVLRNGELIDFWNDHWHQQGILRLSLEDYIT